MTKHKLLFYVYLILSVLGLLGTWYFNFQYFVASDSSYFIPYLKTLLVNTATTAVTIDIYFSAAVFSVWVFQDSKVIKVKWPYIYLILCFSLGLAFAFPLFLAFRERAIMLNQKLLRY